MAGKKEVRWRVGFGVGRGREGWKSGNDVVLGVNGDIAGGGSRCYGLLTAFERDDGMLRLET